MEYNEVEGNLITLAQEGNFDVIAHGCNCFCTMGAGLAPQMAEAFGCRNFHYEGRRYKGWYNKLGIIDFQWTALDNSSWDFDQTADCPLAVVNCYTQYDMGPDENGVPPLNYTALALCFDKMNQIFKGKHIGLPQIGCHLAGGSWPAVKALIQKKFKDCDVTVVIYKPN